MAKSKKKKAKAKAKPAPVAAPKKKARKPRKAKVIDAPAQDQSKLVATATLGVLRGISDVLSSIAHAMMGIEQTLDSVAGHWVPASFDEHVPPPPHPVRLSNDEVAALVDHPVECYAEEAHADVD